MAGIFISYRRSDSDIAAGQLSDDLAEIFGPGSIFRDVDTLEAGEDYENTLDHVLNSCAVLIAVIGPCWSTVADDGGRRRLEASNDWVRIEVSRALARGIRVIPVLISTTMPQEESLPADLRPLLKRQAIELNDRHWKQDLELLTQALEKIPGIARRAPLIPATPSPIRRTLWAVAVITMLVTAGWFGWRVEAKRDSAHVDGKDRNLIFSDDFSLSNMSSLWQPVSGHWYVKDGALHGVDSGDGGSGGRGWAAITIAKQIPRDCSVSFRVLISDGSTAELMLHVSNKKYLRVYIYAIDQAVMLGDGVFIKNDRPGSAGMEEVLTSIGGGITLAQQGFPIKLDHWYAITATASGDEYIVKIGGQKLIDYVDRMNKLSSEGTIGFLTNGHVQVDDLVVTSKSGESG